MTLIVGVAIGIAGIFVFMYLSHRIGGPIYRLEKSVEEAEKGDFAQRVNLRKTDQLFELRDRMNAFLEEIDRRISHLKGEVQKGLDIVNGEKDLSKLKKILEEIKSSLERFKTSK